MKKAVHGSNGGAVGEMEVTQLEYETDVTSMSQVQSAAMLPSMVETNCQQQTPTTFNVKVPKEGKLQFGQLQKPIQVFRLLPSSPNMNSPGSHLEANNGPAPFTSPDILLTPTSKVLVTQKAPLPFNAPNTMVPFVKFPVPRAIFSTIPMRAPCSTSSVPFTAPSTPLPPTSQVLVTQKAPLPLNVPNTTVPLVQFPVHRATLSSVPMRAP
jgi:hypothetical protein